MIMEINLIKKGAIQLSIAPFLFSVRLFFSQNHF